MVLDGGSLEDMKLLEDNNIFLEFHKFKLVFSLQSCIAAAIFCYYGAPHLFLFHFSTHNLLHYSYCY